MSNNTLQHAWDELDYPPSADNRIADHQRFVTLETFDKATGKLG
ncbi:MAG TPA: hypothetical protein VJ124_22515 [Pyrinomonadaceae bacterium]|nr:hypothetical protein [Pyrinomonadaceae bacterium]